MDLSIKNGTLKEVLDQIFLPVNLQYRLLDNTVIISKSNTPELPASQPQSNVVKGKVTDSEGLPLPGVTITIVGTTRGVITDIDGSYTIEANPSDKLVFSFIGMESKIVNVGNQSTIDIELGAQNEELDEVTIVAYGKQRKESVIGAITSMSSENLQIPVSKLSNSLAGQLAGIVSMQSSGEPGSGSNFWIRGVSTFGANNRPLVLVDGVERSLDLVDPEDIQSFSILKDATATAVYGVRGANGIVLITTKRGRETSKPVINAKVEYGTLAPTRLPKLATAEQWMDYYNDISFDASRQIPFPDHIKKKYLDGSDPDLYPNVDWMDEIYKDFTTSQRVNLNVTGGGKALRYFVAGSYYNENGIFDPKATKTYDPSVNYDKFSFRSNLDVNLSKTTRVALSLSNQYERKNRLGVDMGSMYNMLLQTPPISIPTEYSDGTHAQPLVGRNPYYSLNSTGYSNDFWNNSQALLEFSQDLSELVTSGLNFNFKFSWDAYNGSTLDLRKHPATYYATGRDENGNLILHKNEDGSDYLSLARSNRGNRTTNLETSLNYDRSFGEKHRVGGLFLFSMREHTNNFPGDFIAAFPFRNIGIAGRATYSYLDTYFIEGNFGYNGSENFAPENRFGFFPSIALGYLASNAPYFKDMFPFINLLKIKGSYGEIGNDQIGGNRRFAFNSEMQNTGGYHFGTTGQQWRDGIATGHPGNPNVAWESARKSNIGIELGLFEKIELQADVFYDKRDGIYILQESVPSIVGVNVAQYVNLGEMENRGFDASLQYTETFDEFTIQGRANFTFNRNKKLYDDKPTPVWPYQSEVGKVYGQQTGLIALGLFESEEDIKNSPVQKFGEVQPGDIKYKDINGDGIVDSYDFVAIGRSHIPEINYGFGVSMGWKGLDLSLFFQGVGNVTRVINGSPVVGPSGSILVNGQIYSDLADNRWTTENPDPNAKYPRLTLAYNENNVHHSTFFLRDMSFLRLKQGELGYTLPKSITNKVKLSTVRVYLQGVNLLTFSKFKLWDPELGTNWGNIYPHMRTVNLGLNIKI
ncbi:TonB-dependent receptor [Maribellus sp. CM-23]|nr:TonB-dependent receptor [Maribellus sp. CM-23]